MGTKLNANFVAASRLTRYPAMKCVYYQKHLGMNADID